jgi:hypothetical protein
VRYRDRADDRAREDDKLCAADQDAIIYVGRHISPYCLDERPWLRGVTLWSGSIIEARDLERTEKHMQVSIDDSRDDHPVYQIDRPRDRQGRLVFYPTPR